ncbi:hypothetical protein FALBO_7704 [Fusarium albosuccineum]|uniref:Uncharacterized protein n=1 Tax=Fusarium albosuccineum TaxID=1237068 RepID=A0A8H4PJN7_9HYPO|nr:hypothetical protein FALBO_7704 [Fusarium albosuccineum]
MSRLFAVSLVLGLLSTAVRASNPVFGAYPSSQCDTCLDEVYQSCPGDYQTRPYAVCMCAGDGSANFVSCLPYCDGGIDEAGIATSTFYGYCVMFFKELCPTAEQYLDSDIFNKQCSKEAIAAGGIGADEDEDDNVSTAIEIPTQTSGSDSEETGEADETKTEEAKADKTSDAAETSKSTSGATPTAIPALAMIAGLGLQLMNM